MHFLLANDDGINAIGLKALSEAILERGHELTISAPKTQQSATSHHLTLSNPLRTREVPWEGAKAYAIEGTPADCVRMGVQLAEKPIDFVFSGINNGENAGSALYYSGTVAAAREARMLNLKSMAVSIMFGADYDMLLALARLAVRIAEGYEHKELPRMCLINLNAPAIPPAEWKELRIAPISDAFFLDHYERRLDPRGNAYFWLSSELSMEEHKPGTDMALLSAGHVTCTFLGGMGDMNAEHGANLQDILS